MSINKLTSYYLQYRSI